MGTAFYEICHLCVIPVLLFVVTLVEIVIKIRIYFTHLKYQVVIVHAVRACGGSTSIVPLIFNLSAG